MGAPAFDNRPDVANDPALRAARAEWSLRPGVTYLNHGSFGPPPDPVRRARLAAIERLDAEPMEFFVRYQEAALLEVQARLARFVGADPADVALVENATSGMNAVAANFRLAEGDRVLLTDHAYGAVVRIWERACRRAGARLDQVSLPFPPRSEEEVVSAIGAAVTPETRLVVVSHVTSRTALVLPAAAICRAVRDAGAAVCVDGPHAVAMLPLDIAQLGCDFYTASLHKWLSAPFGTGLLYVDRRHQADFTPPLLSWGRMQPAVPERWNEEFLWTGTRDNSSLLAVPAAIDWLEELGLEKFRASTAELAAWAARRLQQVTGLPPLTDPAWHASMTLAPLPPGETLPMQQTLWHEHQIEVPILTHGGHRFARISCHLYNTPDDIGRLAAAVQELLKRGL